MKTIILLIGIVWSSFLFGQQLPQFSQFHRNHNLFNPGANGAYEFIDINLGGRMQWAGFNNSPNTAFFNLSAPLRKSNFIPYNPGIRTSAGPIRNPEIKTGNVKHALGANVIIDQYGAFRKLSFGGAYAIHLPLSKKLNLSFGTKIGLSNNTFLSEKAKTLNNGIDQTYQNYVSGSPNRFILDLGIGLYLYSKRLFVGIAGDGLTKDFVSFGNGAQNFDTRMHFNLIAGYKFQLSENLTLTPSVLAKFTNPSPISLEGNLQLEYKEWLWFGAGYRHEDAVPIMLGANISRIFKIGYSYDINISPIRKFSSGGHELILGLMLGR